MKDCDTLAAAPAICPSGNGFSCRFVVDQPLQFFQPLRFVSAEYSVFSILYHLSKSAEIAGCCHGLHQSRFHPFIFRFRTVKNRIGKRSQVDIHRRNPLRQFLVIDKSLHLDLGSKQFQLHREFQNSHDEEFQVRIFAKQLFQHRNDHLDVVQMRRTAAEIAKAYFFRRSICFVLFLFFF